MKRNVPSLELPSQWQTLPSEIKILGKSWKLRLVEDSLGAENAGLCDVRSKTISLCSDPDLADDAADVVLHEILHSLCYYGKLDLDENEERVVTVLATTLLEVLISNPDLTNWLVDRIQE